jgi:hypothetical protein
VEEQTRSYDSFLEELSGHRVPSEKDKDCYLYKLYAKSVVDAIDVRHEYRPPMTVIHFEYFYPKSENEAKSSTKYSWSDDVE